jgi:hypothetical protein
MSRVRETWTLGLVFKFPGPILLLLLVLFRVFFISQSRNWRTDVCNVHIAERIDVHKLYSGARVINVR